MARLNAPSKSSKDSSGCTVTVGDTTGLSSWCGQSMSLGLMMITFQLEERLPKYCAHLLFLCLLASHAVGHPPLLHLRQKFAFQDALSRFQLAITRALFLLLTRLIQMNVESVIIFPCVEKPSLAALHVRCIMMSETLNNRHVLLFESLYLL